MQKKIKGKETRSLKVGFINFSQKWNFLVSQKFRPIFKAPQLYFSNPFLDLRSQFRQEKQME
jgi:hypothetical protein